MCTQLFFWLKFSVDICDDLLNGMCRFKGINIGIFMFTEIFTGFRVQ